MYVPGPWASPGQVNTKHRTICTAIAARVLIDSKRADAGYVTCFAGYNGEASAHLL